MKINLTKSMVGTRRAASTDLRQSNNVHGTGHECCHAAAFVCSGNAIGRGVARPCRKRQGAFTLVELILVMTILAILAGIVLPKITGRTEQARVTKAKQEIANMTTALGAYEVDTGSYPKGRNGLQALMSKPGGAQNWHGPYLEGTVIPVDPWGNPYVYECPGKHNQSGFDLMSMGPDGRVGGNDDICNWDMSK